MFSRLSRYARVPDVVATDAQGHTAASKDLRLLPAVSGTFLHTVEGVDRLDHLAFKYYRQPRNWWQICDANPEFMAPQALLGKEPLVSVRFAVTLKAEDDVPPWAMLLRQLAAILGVERVQLVEDEIELVPRPREFAGTRVTVLMPRYQRALIVTYNQLNVDVGELVQIMAKAGLIVGQPEPSERVGKPIVIPPNTG